MQVNGQIPQREAVLLTFRAVRRRVEALEEEAQESPYMRLVLANDAASNTPPLMQGTASMVRMAYLGMENQSMRIRQQRTLLRELQTQQGTMPPNAVRIRAQLIATIDAQTQWLEEIMEKMEELMAELSVTPEGANGPFTIRELSNNTDEQQQQQAEEAEE